MFFYLFKCILHINNFQNSFKFCFELRRCIPNSEVYARKNVPIKRIVKDAKVKEFTDIIIVHEDNKKPSIIL